MTRTVPFVSRVAEAVTIGSWAVPSLLVLGIPGDGRPRGHRTGRREARSPRRALHIHGEIHHDLTRPAIQVNTNALRPRSLAAWPGSSLLFSASGTAPGCRDALSLRSRVPRPRSTRAPGFPPPSATRPWIYANVITPRNGIIAWKRAGEPPTTLAEGSKRRCISSE